MATAPPNDARIPRVPCCRCAAPSFYCCSTAALSLSCACPARRLASPPWPPRRLACAAARRRLTTGPPPPHRRTHEVRLAPLDLPTLASPPTGLAAGENAAATAAAMAPPAPSRRAAVRVRPALHQSPNPLALVPTKLPGLAITSTPCWNAAAAAQHRHRSPRAPKPPPTGSSRSPLPPPLRGPHRRISVGTGRCSASPVLIRPRALLRVPKSF